MRKFLLAAIAIMVAFIVKAAPAYPGLITVTQEDGSTISYYLHGDEHFSYMTSTDGYLLATNEAGILEYGDFSNGKMVVPMGVAAHNEGSRPLAEQIYVRGLQKAEAISPRLNSVAKQMRMQAETTSRPVYRFPRSGSPKTIIILVSFKDKAFTKSRQDFENLANQTNYSANGGTGSIKDYFTEVSFNQFTPQFDVYGPYTLDRNMEYYGKQVGSQHDENARDMIIDACNAAYDADVDFTQYDTDHDGFVDNVFVYYAGYNQAEGGGDNTIWPHRSSINYQIGSVKVTDYACTSEFSGAKGSNRMCGIGTFCHEFSHVVGLPDFYDTDYSQGYSAMGSWDIMTSGNYNNGGKTPPTYTAYERFYIGWLTPTPLAEDTAMHCDGSYQLNSLISSNEAFIISKTEHNLNGSGPNPVEFFMLEYRKKEGRDTYTGLGEGMLITHIKYNASKWDANGPNNDKNDLGYEPILPTSRSVQGSSTDCFPGTSGVNYLQLTLRGATEPFKREVINIEDKGDHCEFDFLRNVTNLMVNVKDIDAYTDSPTAVEEFEVDGFDIEENVTLSFKTSTGFKMRKKGDSQYQATLTLTPDADNTIKQTIEVQYTPNKITYDTYEYNKFIAAGSSGKLTKMVDFRYRNRRPVYITTPEANEAKDVNGSSFTANWSYVNDTIEGAKKPSKYYLDLYTISNEAFTEYESFENFPTMNEGWEANFSTTERTYKKDGTLSALFSSSNDTIWTKEFMSDITEISFWMEPITSEGVLKIDVQDYESGTWINAVKVVVNSSTKGGDHKSDPLPAGFRRARVSYAQTSGQVAFDYMGVTTSSTTTFICKNTVVTDTFYKATGLKANTEYVYTVRATDKDEKGRYENVSDYSNEIVTITKEGGDVPKKEDGSTSIALKVAFIEGANRYVVSVSEVISGYSLFVYTLDGKMVKKIAVTESEVVLPELIDGAYILKYTKDGKNNRKDGVTKMYYHLK